MARGGFGRRIWRGLAIVAAVAAPLSARAFGLDGQDAAPRFSLGAGAFDVLHEETAGLFRGEFLFRQQWDILRPFAGIEVSTKGSVYGYAGLGFDIYLDDSWVLYPNFAVGAFSRGDGKELGNTIEFRSGAELDYRFSDSSRIGVSFHHISNAGLGKRNPGEEEALATYSLPISLP